MATGYSKQFLVDAFCFRYEETGLNTVGLHKMANSFYDTVTKDKFRDYCSLDAKEIARYKKFCVENGITY
jgi:hypothetical protein